MMGNTGRTGNKKNDNAVGSRREEVPNDNGRLTETCTALKTKNSIPVSSVTKTSTNIQASRNKTVTLIYRLYHNKVRIGMESK